MERREPPRCVRGLVIRAVNYRDSDVILTLLTAERGRISVNARGARGGRSRLKAGAQLLTCSDFTLYERAGKQYLSAADSVEQFVGLRRSVETLALATYFCEVLETLSGEEVQSEALLQDALNVLFALSKGVARPMLVKAVFELRVAAMAGWAIDAAECGVCGGPPIAPVLDVQNGALACKKCAVSSVLPLCDASVAALRHILCAPSKRMLSFALDGEAAARLSLAAEEYLQIHADKRFSSLDFYKSVQKLGEVV